MTTLNAALNYNFAYAESAKIASAERGAEETIAAQIKQAAQNAPYQVGSTVTARYQYKVAEDGTLVPQQTQITHTAPDDEFAHHGGGRRSRASRDDERRPSFADLAKPKPDLSPTDELSLFADADSTSTAPVDVTHASTTPLSATVQAKADVVDENGETVEAELLTGSTEAESQPKTPFLALLAARAQSTAANLYARNNQIVYSATPLAQFAA